MIDKRLIQPPPPYQPDSMGHRTDTRLGIINPENMLNDRYGGLSPIGWVARGLNWYDLSFQTKLAFLKENGMPEPSFETPVMGNGATDGAIEMFFERFGTIWSCTVFDLMNNPSGVLYDGLKGIGKPPRWVQYHEDSMRTESPVGSEWTNHPRWATTNRIFHPSIFDGSKYQVGAFHRQVEDGKSVQYMKVWGAVPGPDLNDPNQIVPAGPRFGQQNWGIYWLRDTDPADVE